MDSSNSNGNNMVDLDDVLEMEQMVSESLTNTNNGNEIRGETSLELVDNNQNLQHQNIENSIRSEYGRNSHIIQGNDEHQLHSYFGTKQKVQPVVKNVPVRKFTPIGANGPIPPDAKVVMLMKPRAPGERPTFVKLEPVINKPGIGNTMAPSQLSNVRAVSTVPEQRQLRKRRILPPIEKKKPEERFKVASRRGRPPKDSEEQCPTKKLKIQSADGEGQLQEDVKAEESEQNSQDLVNTDQMEENFNRPKRAHKAPQRYGDFYEAPSTQEPTGDGDVDFEVAGEEVVEETQAPNSREDSRESTTTKQKSSTIRQTEDEDDRDYEEESTEVAVSDDEIGEEEETGSREEMNINNKEYHKYVKGKLAKGKLQCDRCFRFFANHNSLNAHRFKVHKIIIRASVKCPGCDHKATTINSLNEHVADVHNVKLRYIKRKFKTVNEFQHFLDDLAATQNMAFVRHRKSENKRHLYCNRSGAVRVTADRHIRNRPRKGSAKIGAMCPAHFFYTECEDGSVEVEGQMTHYGHTLDPRFVFPATSTDKVTERMKPSTSKRATMQSMYGQIPVDLEGGRNLNQSENIANTNTEARQGEEDNDEEELRRMEEEERYEEELGPVHPKAEEIGIRMRNIDRLCTFLFENISEQLYRLDDSTMDILLRSLRTTQNSVSNLNSMMIQIKDGDPDIVKKFQRRGPKVNDWVGNFGSGRLRSDLRRRQKQYYDTDDYDEDTVYYRHVPLRASDINNAYIMDDLEDEEEEEFLGEF